MIGALVRIQQMIGQNSLYPSPRIQRTSLIMNIILFPFKTDFVNFVLIRYKRGALSDNEHSHTDTLTHTFLHTKTNKLTAKVDFEKK